MYVKKEKKKQIRVRGNKNALVGIRWAAFSRCCSFLPHAQVGWLVWPSLNMCLVRAHHPCPPNKSLNKITTTYIIQRRVVIRWDSKASDQPTPAASVLPASLPVPLGSSSGGSTAHSRSSTAYSFRFHGLLHCIALLACVFSLES